MSLLFYGVSGASYLWPWGSLMSSTVFIAPKLAANPSYLRAYTSLVMTVYTGINLVLSLYYAARPAFYADRVRRGERIVAGTFLLLASTLLLPLEGLTWLITAIIIIAVQATGPSTIQNGLISVTQRIPGGAQTRAMFVGQGVAGIVPPILSLAAAWLGGANKPSPVPGAPGAPGDSSGNITAAIAVFLSCSLLSVATLYLFRGSEIDEHFALAEGASSVHHLEAPQSKHVLLQIKGVTFAVFIVLLQSLPYTVFANVARSQNIPAATFAPLTHFIWNLGDLSGRLVCEKDAFQLHSSRQLVMYGVIRCAFVPVLVLLVHGGVRDSIYLLVQFIFGLTNGHLLTSAFLVAPKLVAPDVRAAAGGLLNVVLSVGLLCGSIISFLLLSVL